MLLPGGELAEGEVEIAGRSIVYAGTPRAGVGRAWEHDGWIVPGFYDLHLHGAAGCDTMDGTPRALDTIAAWAASGGTTGFMATTMTAPEQQLARVVENAARYQGRGGARLMGIHLEGPFISPHYAGAHSRAAVAMDPGVICRLTECGRGRLGRVTLAPELPAAPALIQWLRRQGVVVSLGHTDATYAQVRVAQDAGASMVTHTFNAMRGFHHREPGAAGAALDIDGLYLEVILDGHHVHEAAFRLLWRARPGSVFLATDAIPAAGMAPGRYQLGGHEIWAEGGRATLPGGTLAGSLLTMSRAVHNAVGSGIPLVQAAEAASGRPARAAGWSNRGRLIAGHVADVVLLTTDLDVLVTIVEGEVVFSR